MTFPEGTDQATQACITLADIAQAAGVSDNAIRRARLDPSTPNYRSPPEGWREALAALARARGAALLELADRLDAAPR